MADVKISGLLASTTPLAGTEVLPIVQDGITKQVSVNNLTAGKPVSAGAITSTGKFYGYIANDSTNIPTWFGWNNSGVLSVLSGGDSAFANVFTKVQGGIYNQASTNNFDLVVQSKDPGKDAGWRVTAGSGANAGANNGYFSLSSFTTDTTAIVATERMRWFSSGGVSVSDTTDPGAGNFRVGTGNLIIGTSGKGVVMTNAAGTVTKRVRLNDAGDGLIFENV